MPGPLTMADRVGQAMAARHDPGPIVAYHAASGGYTWWTANRVYSRDPVTRSIVSLPRHPPETAVIGPPTGDQQ